MKKRDVWELYFDGEVISSSVYDATMKKQTMSIDLAIVSSEFLASFLFESIPKGLTLVIGEDSKNTRSGVDTNKLKISKLAEFPSVFSFTQVVEVSKEKQDSDYTMPLKMMVDLHDELLSNNDLLTDTIKIVDAEQYNIVEFRGRTRAYKKLLVTIRNVLFNREKLLNYRTKILADLEMLESKKNDDIFTEIFNFPTGYESICSQYLMWFGEFLSSLGVGAEVSVENDGDQTKVIVAPSEADELLTDIEKLFYQYLQLPYAEVLPPEGKVLTAEMQSQLITLQNQIMFFNTQIQSKDATIALLNAANNQLTTTVQQQNEKMLLLESLKEPKDIEFGDGAVKIGEKDLLGFIKVNPKKALDYLKRKKKTDN